MDLKRHAYEYFRMKGFADHQAAAMAAHMDQESGGNTRAVHDKGTGLGIYGWRDPEPGKGRKTDLINWATKNNLDPHALNTQLDFAVHELSTSEKAAGDKIRGAKTYQDAINAGMSYLRPQGYTADNPYGGHNYTGRYNAGADLAGVAPLTGTAIAAAGDSGATTPTAPGGDYQTIVAGLLAKQQEQAAATAKAAELAEEAKQMRAMQSVTKEGLGLLGQGETAAPQMAMAPGGIQRPQVQAAGNPDFLQMLAQQRLMRRA